MFFIPSEFLNSANFFAIHVTAHDALTRVTSIPRSLLYKVVLTFLMILVQI